MRLIGRDGTSGLRLQTHVRALLRRAEQQTVIASDRLEAEELRRQSHDSACERARCLCMRLRPSHAPLPYTLVHTQCRVSVADALERACPHLTHQEARAMQIPLTPHARDPKRNCYSIVRQCALRCDSAYALAQSWLRSRDQTNLTPHFREALTHVDAHVSFSRACDESKSVERVTKRASPKFGNGAESGRVLSQLAA
eukprot:762753-Pleurochrysis_carterae.AAC.3